jgi:membrane-bound lytic murein transglycosylase D
MLNFAEMFTKILVPGLLVLASSFTSRPSGGYSTYLKDTTDLLIKDSLQVKGANDPKAALREIPVEEFTGFGILQEQLHPMAISFTDSYRASMGRRLASIKEKIQPQFYLIESIFNEYELPGELKYLAIVESQLQTRARSHMGAVGPWQFMPVTARAMGLKVTRSIDERRDLTKSTHAAAKYLRYLFKEYGDWLLVIAAYNGGPGNVNKAIRLSGSRDFWKLQHLLPRESRNHVKKYIATQVIMAGFAGITALTKDESERLQPELIVTNGIEPATEGDKATLARPISGRYHSSIIARHLDMDPSDFMALNPGFDRMIATHGTYELRLPADKMETFLARKPEILTESLERLLDGGLGKN